MTVEESLTRFRTISFAYDHMRPLMRLTRDGALDASVWFAFVPEVYSVTVQPICNRVAAHYIGRPMTSELLDELVAAMSKAIGLELEPVLS